MPKGQLGSLCGGNSNLEVWAIKFQEKNPFLQSDNMSYEGHMCLGKPHCFIIFLCIFLSLLCPEVTPRYVEMANSRYILRKTLLFFFLVRWIGTGKRCSCKLESIGESWREDGWKRRSPNSVYVLQKLQAHPERHMYRRDPGKLSRSFESWTRISTMTHISWCCMAILTS